MSEERVRWGIKAKLYTNKPHVRMLGLGPFSERRMALIEAGKLENVYEARIVKLTRKKKPRVVAREMWEGTAQYVYGDATRIVSTVVFGQAVQSDFISKRLGRRIRVILEELADE